MKLNVNWKNAGLLGLSATAAAACVFFPPAFVSSGIASLAGTSLFAGLGGAGYGVATAVVASAAAAATYFGSGLVGKLSSALTSSLNWLRNLLPGRTANESAANQETEKKSETPSAPGSAVAMAAMGPSVPKTERQENQDAASLDDKNGKDQEPTPLHQRYPSNVQPDGMPLDDVSPTSPASPR